MDFTKGMKCPNCNEENYFHGGNFGGSIESVNYTCECGFSAVLIINWQNQYDGFEIKGIKFNDETKKAIKDENSNG